MERVLLLVTLCLLCPLPGLGHMIHYRSADSNPSVLKLEYGSPTTPNISEIFIGRCNEYVQCLQQGRCGPSTLRYVDMAKSRLLYVSLSVLKLEPEVRFIY